MKGLKKYIMIISEHYSHLCLETISILHRKAFRIPKNKVLFLDRDGVLIDDVHYINSANQVNIPTGVRPFLQKARELDYDICVVTNQSSIGRKLIDIDDYLAITQEFLSNINIDLYPDFILANFHLPDSKMKTSHWRKPGTGMFQFILKNFSYSPDNCLMYGDKLSDLIPAYKSGINKVFFVETIQKQNEIKKVIKWYDSIDQKVDLTILKELKCSNL